MVEPGDRSSIERLEVWKKAVDLAILINNEVLPKISRNEKYALIDQLRRSSQSISANIAEGTGRYYYQDTVRFCYIARGSLEETYTQIILAVRMGYITEQEAKPVFSSIQDVRKLISGYIEYLKRTKRGETEPGNRITEEAAIYETIGYPEEE
jgi:four helix bundle protein